MTDNVTNHPTHNNTPTKPTKANRIGHAFGTLIGIAAATAVLTSIIALIAIFVRAIFN